MGSQFDALGLNSAAVPLLRDLILARSGLFFEAGRLDLLAERIATLVVDRGFTSFLDYYYLLKYDESGADEWPKVMDALSVPETYFWREIDQVRAVADAIVPALADRLNGVPLRIWSIPCASGEEPLTLAMMLDMAGWFGRLPIEIHASDASPAQLARARAGRYRERSFRALPAPLRERYFRRDGDAWVPDEALASRITSWSMVNLMDHERVTALARVPIIFCRNLFIYFSADGIRDVVRTFAGAMPTPGYLFVGASESLLRVTTEFVLEEIGGAFVYVKR